MNLHRPDECAEAGSPLMGWLTRSSGHGQKVKPNRAVKRTEGVICADPFGGVLVTAGRRDFANSLPNQSRVAVEGRHFVQEDAPDAIGAALAEWIPGLPKGSVP